MATAGTATVDVTGEYIFNNSKGCTSFTVHVLSGSTSDALVNVPGLHDEDDFFVVLKGQTFTFRLFDLGIRKVFVKGSGGDATINYGVLEKTIKN